MAQEKVSMRKVREILRLRYDLGLRQDQIARSCNIGQSTVHRYLERFAATGLGWSPPPTVTMHGWRSCYSLRAAGVQQAAKIVALPTSRCCTTSCRSKSALIRAPAWDWQSVGALSNSTEGGFGRNRNRTWAQHFSSRFRLISRSAALV